MRRKGYNDKRRSIFCFYFFGSAFCFGSRYTKLHKLYMRILLLQFCYSFFWLTCHFYNTFNGLYLFALLCTIRILLLLCPSIESPILISLYSASTHEIRFVLLTSSDRLWVAINQTNPLPSLSRQCPQSMPGICRTSVCANCPAIDQSSHWRTQYRHDHSTPVGNAVARPVLPPEAYHQSKGDSHCHSLPSRPTRLSYVAVVGAQGKSWRRALENVWSMQNVDLPLFPQIRKSAVPKMKKRRKTSSNQ